MTRNLTNDEMLMRYVDGELSPVESRAVERDLSASPELARKRDALLEMRDLLRARFELAEEEVEPQLVAMWERVRTGLPSTSARRVPARSMLARFRDWAESYRSHFVTGVLAAATGALVATFVTSKMAANLPGAGTAQVAESAEVESLEVLGGSGMVFQEPAQGKDDTGTTVIWVSANEPNDDGSDGDDATPNPAATPPPAEGGTL